MTKEKTQNSISSRITDYLILVKTRPVVKRLKHSMNFPVPSKVISKVMVILPRNLALLDQASIFVQSLRKTYPAWRVELFDVDKLDRNDLNRMQLPRQEVLDRLRKADYQFVLDLNDGNDRISSYIALMTEAPYRLHMRSDGKMFYNISYQPQNTNGEYYYEPLLNYLRRLFVKS